MSRERDALETALGALRHRDLSADELEARLTAREFDDAEREAVLATLMRTGLIDDGRFAESRARSLADRGAGNALIHAKLVQAGVALDVVNEALDELELETARARRIVERRGPGARTARYLAAKGFSSDVIAAVVAAGQDDALG